MRAAILTGLLVLSTSGTTPVAASTSGPPRANSVLADQQMQIFARCIVRGGITLSINSFLMTNPYMSDAGISGSKVADPGCVGMNADLAMQPSLLRGAFYEALYDRDFRHSHVLPTSTQQPLGLEAEVTGDDPEVHTAFVSIRQFGDCVVRQNATNARTLLLTDIDSKEETAAIAGLQPSLSICLFSGQLHFSHLMLRGVLAEALYKLSLGSAPRHLAHRTVF